MSTAVPSFPSQATPDARGQRGDPAPAPANLKDGARIEAPKPPARQLEPAPAAPLAPARDDDLPRPGEVVDGFWWTPKWAQPLVKYRWVLVVLWLGMHVAAFNGQWRIGADSATFRSVARSLAAGEGYAILGEPQTQVYPGLPFLLAGLERLFGPAAWPGVLVTLAASAGVLWFTYHLIRRIAPAWVATVVTAGVGFNEFFVSLSHELMTDIPFLLGVVMALWGWETLTDPGLARRLRSGLCLAAGLALAASMRPTFWVLALALGAVCVGGLLVGLFPRFAPRAWTSGRDQARSWRFYATCLSVVFVVGLLFAVVDPRTRTLDLLEGGYESEVAERVLRVEDRIRETPDKLWEMLEDHLEALFFAERVEFLNLLLVATLLVGVVLVARRRPLWGGLVGVLLVVVFFASSTPRYYMMVLPVLWLGWATVMMSASRLFRRDWPRGAFLLATLGGVLLCNVAHDAKFVVEQRGTPFIESYKDGLYVPVVAMAQTLREHTAPGDVIIGPFGPEMTYLSHRRVLGRRHILTGYESSSRDQALAVEATGADWMVFPTDVYGHKDSPIDRLGREGILVPTNEDDSTVISAGEFDGRKWYFTTWAVDHTMLPGPGQAD